MVCQLKNNVFYHENENELANSEDIYKSLLKILSFMF